MLEGVVEVIDGGSQKIGGDGLNQGLPLGLPPQCPLVGFALGVVPDQGLQDRPLREIDPAHKDLGGEGNAVEGLAFPFEKGPALMKGLLDIGTELASAAASVVLEGGRKVSGQESPDLLGPVHVVHLL